ncbi:SHOCT domain-containing protein [Cellulomonas sp. URHD0024]|uniref:SHOCT domain-containing protein n=1 Tax=Cellulomonas sp. URHD0024 TaxID=1302620 RepID=UPI0003F5DFCA|nr:SHOCT domain-containing protein [Cellulomonas sp. URHD0024]
MGKQRKAPIEDRLSRYAVTRDLSRGLGKGIDKLPVSELTKTVIKVKSGQVVAVTAETSVALAASASAAAKAGVERFDQVRHELADVPPAPSPAPEPPAVDLVASLERLKALHESGGLDDQEFAAAKARLLDQFL